jgi:hypothetical protein
MGKVIDLVGQQFGRLLVQELMGIVQRRAFWRCVCSCGQICETTSGSLRDGRTQSCGCLLREKSSERAQIRNQHQRGAENRNFRHGGQDRHASELHQGTYRIWSNMLTRATNKNFHGARAYRNVGVCERWLTFENFLADMGDRPSPKHSLSRHLDTGDYEPGNVDWGTWADQGAEKRGKTAMRDLHEYNQKMAFLEVLA